MTREQATAEARREADKNRVTMVVVDAPIENAEENAPFGYCPQAAKSILFRFGTIVETIPPTKSTTV